MAEVKLAKRGKVAVLKDYFLKYREVSVGQKGKEVVLMRLKDAKFKLKVVWKHRREYPHSVRAISVELLRLIVFGTLRYLPEFVHKFLFRLKNSLK